jgi:hypothetical protein
MSNKCYKSFYLYALIVLLARESRTFFIFYIIFFTKFNDLMQEFLFYESKRCRIHVTKMPTFFDYISRYYSAYIFMVLAEKYF